MERLKKKETKMLEREETILRSQHQASQVKFVGEATRKTFQCLSSNNSYKPGENAFEKIKNCELGALKNQEETFRMFNCMRQRYFGSFGNAAQPFSPFSSFPQPNHTQYFQTVTSTQNRKSDIVEFKNDEIEEE
ncbi:hypothetical protein ACTA71_004771 [Dictyostelium dimigraforme]